MKIYLLSDLHVEFHGDYPMPKSPVDVVVLAGDIDVGLGVLGVAEQYAQRCKVPVIVVAGNHEYYHSDYLTLLPALRDRAAELTDVHFLEKDSVVINGVRFLGCTLWSDFAFNGAAQAADAKATAQRYIADFRVIKYSDRRFTPDDASAEFEASYRWLDNELAKPFNGETVVITHFLPHRAGVHPMYLRGDNGDHLTPYFTVDCRQLMHRHRITAWLYGHTHNSIDVTVDWGTRLVSNQRGYPQEPWTYTRYDPQKILDLTATAEERDRLEGARRFAVLIEESGGVYTTQEIAHRLQRSQLEIHNMITNNELLAYKQDRRWWLPVTQFDPVTGQPVAGLQQVLHGFASDMDGKSKVIFCLSFFESTGKTPLQLLSEGFNLNGLAQAVSAHLTQSS